MSACTVDGLDIVEHAKSGECPNGKFDAAELEADLAAAGYGPGHPDFPGNSDCCGGGKTK